MQYYFAFLLLLQLMIAKTLSEGRFEDYSRLRRDLLNNYDKGQIPAKDAKTPANATLGMTLLNNYYIRDGGYMVSNAWLEQGWEDFRLQWEPSDYDGITQIAVHYSQIWTPDIALFNSIKPHDLTPPSEEAQVIVYNTGNVLMIRHVELNSACKVQRVEPYECTIKMGSWVHSAARLDLRNTSNVINMKYHFDNPSIVVTKTEVKRNLEHYDCCPEAYIDISFKIWMKKRRFSFGTHH